MHKFYLIIVLIIAIGCSQKQTNENIIKFEKVLGKRQTNALNLLVADFEQNLNKKYPDLPIKQAYRQYLTDLVSKSADDRESFEFQSEKTNLEFNQSGLWDEIYQRDSENGLQTNSLGSYMLALYAIKKSDTVINKYYDVKEQAGIMSNEIVVSGILSLSPDFDNYFHKRIVVVEFSF